MKLTIQQTDVIKVEFTVVGSKSKLLMLYVDESVEKIKEKNSEQVDDMDLENAENHHFVFKLPDYGDINSIMQKTVVTENENVKIDISGARFVKMATLIKSWSLRNGEKELVVTDDNIKTLNPILAGYIGDKLDEMTNFDN